MRLADITTNDFTRIVVAVDPAVTANEDSDDTGIVVVGRGPHVEGDSVPPCEIPFCPGHGYVLDDQTCHLLPADAMKLVVKTYDKWEADRVVAETNNGADYIGTVLHAVRAGIPYSVVTGTRGKKVRAEPASALSEQGRVHFMGAFPELEEELNTWDPEVSSESPDRLDALVWGLTFLELTGGQGAAFMRVMKDELAARTGTIPPPELRMLPKLDNEFTLEPAKEKCTAGAHHRFMKYGDGSYQCAVCGGWKAP